MLKATTFTYKLSSRRATAYEYYANGNLKRITDTLSGKYVEYDYDEYNRLIEERNGFNNRRYVMEYDEVGNILAKTEYNLASGTKLYYYDYYYGGAWKDQLTVMAILDVQADAYILLNGIEYDGAGNPVNYKGDILKWKNGRQLASYGSNTFDYDYSGIRTRKNDTYYYLEGSRILAEQTATLSHGFIMTSRAYRE